MLCDEMLEYQAIQTLLYMSPILLRYSFRPGGPSSILGTRSSNVSVRTFIEQIDMKSISKMVDFFFCKKSS